MKDKKPVYETPLIIPLGELARGAGAKPPVVPPPCRTGNNATLTCVTGGAATTNCQNGAYANRCASGAQP